jgi:hypothetical protein
LIGGFINAFFIFLPRGRLDQTHGDGGEAIELEGVHGQATGVLPAFPGHIEGRDLSLF